MVLAPPPPPPAQAATGKRRDARSTKREIFICSGAFLGDLPLVNHDPQNRKRRSLSSPEGGRPCQQREAFVRRTW